MELEPITIGGFTVTSTILSSFSLDGGAMFGSVPKGLWEKHIEPDEDNRIPLVSRCLLLEGEGERILVDCGCGYFWKEKERARFAIASVPQEDLPKEVTSIILTHLHFDHAGGLAKSHSDGEVVPLYPGAKVYLQKENFETALSPLRKEKASYRQETLQALSMYDVMYLEGSGELFPGVELTVVHGHTRGQQILRVSDEENTLIFASDLIPTSHHIHPAYHMGYDMCAETLLVEKEQLLRSAAKAEALVVFAHDPVHAARWFSLDKNGEVTSAEYL